MTIKAIFFTLTWVTIYFGVFAYSCKHCEGNEFWTAVANILSAILLFVVIAGIVLGVVWLFAWAYDLELT